jgi:hypothetical protein
MLTKEKSNQKRKGVNNQNNSSFLFELFPFINTIFTSALSFKDSIKEKKLWSKERVVPHYQFFVGEEEKLGKVFNIIQHDFQLSVGIVQRKFGFLGIRLIRKSLKDKSEH